MIFCKNICCVQNLKNHLVDFHKIYTVGTSKPLDVQCKFMFKSGRKILSYRYFKILVQHVLGEGKVLIQNFLFHRFISWLLLKLAL